MRQGIISNSCQLRRLPVYQLLVSPLFWPSSVIERPKLSPAALNNINKMSSVRRARCENKSTFFRTQFTLFNLLQFKAGTPINNQGGAGLSPRCEQEKSTRGFPGVENSNSQAPNLKHYGRDAAELGIWSVKFV